ncbi:MAG: major facilitator superfamily protein [Clostridia bacterium]|jgi:MFS family permease|nr:major facilitator superfamily protein [Clostridia bacterium]
MKVKERFGDYLDLPKSIWILFVARIINSMGNFVYPFLTLFLTKKIGLSASQAGNFFIASAILSMMGSLLGGKLADHFGRKKLMMIFQGATATLFFACAFLGNSIWVPILLCLAGMFNGAAQPANSAMVTDLTNKENRKLALSLLYLGINFGFAVGPTIAGFLYNNYISLIFYGNAGSILISLILIGCFIKETAPTKEEIENSKQMNDDESAEDTNVFHALIKRPTLFLFLLGRTINQLVYSTIGFAIPIQMAKTFGDVLGPKYFGYLMSFTGIVVITLTIFTIKVTGRIRPVLNVAMAGVFYAVGFGMLGFVSSFWLFLLSGLIFTIGEILEVTNAGVYVANHSPINHRGRFNAIIPLVTGMGSTFGPKIFGMVIDNRGLTTMWMLCFVLAMISSIFMLWLRVFEDKWNEKKYGRA